MTLKVTNVSIVSLCIVKLTIMTLSITSFSIITLPYWCSTKNRFYKSQHNNTYHNDSQHNNAIITKLSIMTLTKFTFCCKIYANYHSAAIMLNVGIQSAVTLKVVASLIWLWTGPLGLGLTCNIPSLETPRSPY
jgi:hypothetical protein